MQFTSRNRIVFEIAVTQAATDPVALLGGLITAVQGHHWGVVIGFVLTGVTYALRTWVLPKWAFIQTDRGGAIFAIGVAVVSTLATELIAGVTAWTSILDALAAAMSSAGGYSLVKKIIAPSPTAPPAPTV
jgi:hypothetical protein